MHQCVKAVYNAGRAYEAWLFAGRGAEIDAHRDVCCLSFKELSAAKGVSDRVNGA